MRLLIDSLIALMLLGIFAAVLLNHRHEQQRIEHHRRVRESVLALNERALYQSALREAAGDAERYPDTIERGWFGSALPLNTLAAADQPWMDVAPEGDHGEHPPDPVLRGEGQAAFWYNPQLGVFRARVPAQASDDDTLTLYNRVNGTTLPTLPIDDDPARRPTLPDWGAAPGRLPPPVAAADGRPPDAHEAPAHGSTAPVADDEDAAPRRSLLGPPPPQ